jgi:uncharacterized protein YdeI (YjbR/CyaY-like superfamily)
VKPHDVRFFDAASDLRSWFEANHASAGQQWIGFYKKGSGRSAMTYAEAVDEALCFGWIDGQLGGLDEQSYAIRFTPRRAGSLWSTANVKRIGELKDARRMHAAGLTAFEARRADRTGLYISDMSSIELPAELEADFRANAAAWDFWNQQPPSYRRQMTWWVISAKRDDTRQRRLTALVDEHAAGRRIDPLNLPKVSVRDKSG